MEQQPSYKERQYWPLVKVSNVVYNLLIAVNLIGPNVICGALDYPIAEQGISGTREGED